MMKKTLATLCLMLITLSLSAQDITREWVERNYTKREVMIPMRDGVKLFTAIYEPINAGKLTPIMMSRTPYQASPYGEGYSSTLWGKLRNYVRERYVIVLQDVRGRWMSEGDFVDVRPYIENKQTKQDIDEASDTYDTAEWLVNNVQCNGSIGVLGTSYPGFYTTMAGLSGHPAMKAVAPQAPVTDWWMGDDYHHHGVLMITDMLNFVGQYFGRPRPVPTKTQSRMTPFFLDDEYSFFLRKKTNKALTELMGDSIAFWKDLMAHPNYDAFWQARDPRPHLHDVKPAVLVVGGLFDAEDCYGTWGTYKSLKALSPQTQTQLIMGPWFHGAWERDRGNHLGDIYFGANTSEFHDVDADFTKTMKVGKVLTQSSHVGLPFLGDTLYSRFKIDGVQCWDYLRQRGYEIKWFVLERPFTRYELTKLGKVVAKITPCNVKDPWNEASMNVLRMGPGVYRIEIIDCRLDDAVMAAFIAARADMVE